MSKGGHNGVNGREEPPLDDRADLLAAFQAELEAQLNEPDTAPEEKLPRFDARFVALEICALDYLQFVRIHSALSWESGKNLDQERKNGMKRSTKDDAKGKLRQAKGVIKQAAGKIAGSPGLKAEGHVDETAGKIQQKVARVEKALGH
jgi:uncharacterized protein YjbJ (UPF0337 family)